MDSELLTEILQGIKGMGAVEALLIFTMASFDLSIVPGRVRTDQLVLDSQLPGGLFKQGGLVLIAGKAVCKLEAVVRLTALDFDSATFIPPCQPLEEVRGGIGRLLRVGCQKAQPGKLVDGCILEQAKLRVGDALSGDNLYIHLDPLAGIQS